jgi:hypothetical protein
MVDTQEEMPDMSLADTLPFCLPLKPERPLLTSQAIAISSPGSMSRVAMKQKW